MYTRSFIPAVPLRLQWTGFASAPVSAFYAIVAGKTAMKKSQSAVGLIRALGVDLAAVPRTRPIYRRLVDLFERTISRGQIAPGVTPPPERELARAFRVSRTTVVTAYRELE